MVPRSYTYKFKHLKISGKKIDIQVRLLFICPSAPSNVNGLETENSALKMECSIVCNCKKQETNNVNLTLGEESLLKFPLYYHVKDKIQNKKN